MEIRLQRSVILLTDRQMDKRTDQDEHVTTYEDNLPILMLLNLYVA